jgi:aminomethyltransferase
VAENQYWLSVADRDVWSWTKGLAIGLNMQVDIQEPDVSPLAVQGPKSFDVVADLFGDWVREMKYFWSRETELEGIPLVLTRTGWSKQGGYELYLRDGSYGDRLWETVMEAGKPHDIKPATPSSIERVEGGLLNYWEDMTDETNPFEIGMGKFVALDEDFDFIGKQALKKIKEAGVKRKLVGLEIHSEPLARLAERWPVKLDGHRLGEITSAVYSPDLEKNIAFAMVDIECPDVGARVAIDMGEGDTQATVSSIPFIDSREKVWHGAKKQK